MFWLRHIEEVQLYLKAWFSSENSYVFTAATFMGFDDNEHLPFLLMGDKHVLDGPLSKYSEIRSKMPAGKDAEILYEQIGVAAEDNLKLRRDLSRVFSARCSKLLNSCLENTVAFASQFRSIKVYMNEMDFVWNCR